MNLRSNSEANPSDKRERRTYQSLAQTASTAFNSDAAGRQRLGACIKLAALATVTVGCVVAGAEGIAHFMALNAQTRGATSPMITTFTATASSLLGVSLVAVLCGKLTDDDNRYATNHPARRKVVNALGNIKRSGLIGCTTFATAGAIAGELVSTKLGLGFGYAATAFGSVAVGTGFASAVGRLGLGRQVA